MTPTEPTEEQTEGGEQTVEEPDTHREGEEQTEEQTDDGGDS